MEKKADVLIEVSWEVCNKVGGIYTVVKSKAARMKEIYKDNYLMIGPFFPAKVMGDFEEKVPDELFKPAFEELKKAGIICHYGKWLIEGNPSVILIDFMSQKHRINDIKSELWQWYNVDSLYAPPDFDEPVTWAYAAGIVIDKIHKRYGDRKVVAQFHEWLAGAGLLYLKKKGARIATVFTTHATVLGRTLANSQIDLYNVWERINPDEEAKKYNIQSKHLLEKMSAQTSDAFTTVSEITGLEASHFLKRKPDVFLPNGLDISKFPTFEQLTIKHAIQRDRIREFFLFYFFPYYIFDPKETLIYFLAGRYEFHDKGIDVYIRALGRLNQRMLESKSQKTVIAFIWVPANIRNIKPELLENKTLYQDIKDALEEVRDDVEKNLVYSLVSNKKIDKEALFDEDFLTEIKIRTNKFIKKGKPPVSTHDLFENNDTILNAIREAGLNNSEGDRVKVIFYPIYLSGADGLLNLNYYEAMQGSHLGIFPSYYEPWGYTPLEAGALGVSSITTDLAGFGRFFCKECKHTDESGIFILKRMNRKYDDIVEDLSDIMFNFASLSKEERVENKLAAWKVASTADWKKFAWNYIEAHNFAIGKIYK